MAKKKENLTEINVPVFVKEQELRDKIKAGKATSQEKVLYLQLVEAVVALYTATLRAEMLTEAQVGITKEDLQNIQKDKFGFPSDVLLDKNGIPLYEVDANGNIDIKVVKSTIDINTGESLNKTAVTGAFKHHLAALGLCTNEQYYDYCKRNNIDDAHNPIVRKESVIYELDKDKAADLGFGSYDLVNKSSTKSEVVLIPADELKKQDLICDNDIVRIIADIEVKKNKEGE